jgi:hypothetical protein
VIAILLLFPVALDDVAVAVFGSTCWQADTASTLIIAAQTNNLER